MSDAQDHYDDTPGAKKTGTGVGAEKWEGFQAELKERSTDIANLLPRHITKEKFMAVAVAAVKQNPDLLFADKRTLFGAVTKAAQDGLLPDGREGFINIYNTNIAKKGQPDQWIKAAAWMPMIYGLRKRARELDRLIVDAQVVYEGDVFKRQQGDDPKIIHEPADFGKPRGKMQGAYAIYKAEDGTILHREVMDAEQVEMARAQSKMPDSLMWKKFPEEGYRKTVVRRGFKSVPVSEPLESIVRRDDDMFEFNQDRVPLMLVPPPAPPLTPPPAPKAEQTTETATTLPGDWDSYLDRQKDELASAKTAQETQAIHDTVEDTVAGARERGEISEIERETIMAAWAEAAG
jgi:phage RecT family recombinase